VGGDQYSVSVMAVSKVETACGSGGRETTVTRLGVYVGEAGLGRLSLYQVQEGKNDSCRYFRICHFPQPNGFFAMNIFSCI
jgi:hypothetical protein